MRSGDTPQRERQAMLRKPPHILITTPESLYLLLTSPKAREMFRTVRTVIVDEIHTLAGNKRGVHLSLSLERLQHLAAPAGPAHRPLGHHPPAGRGGALPGRQRVAMATRQTRIRVGDQRRRQRQCPKSHAGPRPVTIVDAGYRKPLDLQVETVGRTTSATCPASSIWPSIIPRVLELIRQHQTTLIFANNRRLAERTADRLNEQIAAEAAGQAVRPHRRRRGQRHRLDGGRHRRARRPDPRPPRQHVQGGPAGDGTQL